MDRVLITGANGFVGGSLCHHLQARGWTVRGSVRSDSARLPEGIETVVTGGIDAKTDWSRWLDGVDAVVHCAARVHVLKETDDDPLSAFRRVNVDASRRLAEQAAEAGVRHFVFLSSIGAKIAAADADRALPYQRSKLEAETVLRETARSQTMVLVILRPPLVYGYAAPGNFQRLVALIAAGWPLPLSGLANRRSLLFVGNLAGAVESALRCEASPATALELSDGENISTGDLARRIARACGRPARLFPRSAGSIAPCRTATRPRRRGRVADRQPHHRQRRHPRDAWLVTGFHPGRGPRGQLPGPARGLAAMSRASNDKAAQGAFGRGLAAATFGSYRLLARVASPLVRRHLKQRLARGREDPLRMTERLGEAGVPRPPGPLLWIHTASVGEAQSALPLIDRLQQEWSGFAILMTSGTVTSARLLAERLPAGVIHQFVPVDLPAAVAGFLDHWHPDIALFVESEFWPNLVRTTAERGVELVLLNGRVSPASYRHWRRARPLIAELLSCFSLLMARSPEDHDRLLALGAGKVVLGGNLKASAPPLIADQAELARLERDLVGRPRWLAASAHPGEDSVAGEVHVALRNRFPKLLTLLAPRHPDRAEEIRDRLEALGLNVAQRSRHEALEPAIDVYLADTIGEMGLWYRLAEIVFIGGSLIPKGGQNMLEPAKLGCAILSGPHNANFSDLSGEMAAVGGLRLVDSTATLAAAIAELQENPAARQAMISAAESYAAGQAGVLDQVMKVLQPLLQEALDRS